MPRAKKTEETKPVAKKPAAKKTTTKPKAPAKKPATKPKTTAKKPAAKPKAAPKPRAKKVVEPAVNVVVAEHNDTKFPYETFPYRLEHKEEKGKKICWFQHESHATKYIERHKLNKKDYTLECSFVNGIRSNN
jgi:hypothetical protein